MEAEGGIHSVCSPISGPDNRIGGVVLQMFDIDPLKRSMQQVEKARDYADAIVTAVAESLLVLDSSLRLQSVNRSFCFQFGTTSVNSVGRSIVELDNGDGRPLGYIRSFDAVLTVMQS